MHSVGHTLGTGPIPSNAYRVHVLDAIRVLISTRYLCFTGKICTEQPGKLVDFLRLLSYR